MEVDELKVLLKRDHKKQPLETDEIDYVISEWNKKVTPSVVVEQMRFKVEPSKEIDTKTVSVVVHQSTIDALELANIALEELKQKYNVCKKQTKESNSNAVRWTKQKDEIATKYHVLNKTHERLKISCVALEKKILELESRKNK